MEWTRIYTDEKLTEVTRLLLKMRDRNIEKGADLYEALNIAIDAIGYLPRVRKTAMISQPMGGKSEEEIRTAREKAVKVLTEKGYAIANTLFTDEWYSDRRMKERGVVQIPLCFLAMSLESMSSCHAVYFCKGWEQARGCRIEHDAAVAYGLDIIYEA